MSTHRSPRPLARRLPALLLALAALACDSSSGATPAAKGGPGGGPGGPGRNRDAPVPVEVAEVGTGVLARTVTVSGIVEPLRTVGVNAQLGGALLSVRVREGDRVGSGQVMAEVDARELSAQVRGADAQLRLARTAAERAEQLWQDRVIVAAEYERDQAAYAAAQASLEQLRTRLGFATIRAPITGVVTERLVEAGDLVQGQSRLFTVADLSTLIVRVQISELEVAGIARGAEVDVTADALRGRGFRGTVRRVYPAADSATRMVPVEIGLPGATAGPLRPGYTARVTFSLGEGVPAVLVPSAALVGEASARAVFVVRGDRAERRPVRVGRASGDRTEVLEGVTAGETVVVAGAAGLREGALVRVVPPVGEPATRGATVGNGPAAPAQGGTR